jgi:NAD(P)-dependent dehydrogenase (short-subunit alcohol dehydrogenase family)
MISSNNFEGKVFLITGGTSGLGAATAKLLASRGAKVAITGRRAALGAAVVDTIKADGGDALFLQTDVTDFEQLKAMISDTVSHFGRLDGAVNNAGISPSVGVSVADIEDEHWHSTIDTNLNAVWMSMKVEIPALLASGGGSIVNISSVYGLVGSDVGHAAYAASKFAVIGLTKTAAIEYGIQGVRINALCPGYCHSEMVDPAVEALPDVFVKLLDRHSSMNRLGEADEVAEAIAWLLSPASSFVNGAALPINGGDGMRIF